jgi:hypothetical protein
LSPQLPAIFTHKSSGNGLGAAPGNEIASNHDAKIPLLDRDKGGLSLSFP